MGAGHDLRRLRPRDRTVNQTYGVFGQASNGAAFALWAQGNAHVAGTLSKTAGSFKIDHPLDPERKWLQHSFVESPDMMNVYNGNVVLDAAGTAVVELPDYFDALNTDFRYQLTPIGASAPVYIARKVSGNKFGIAGGTPGLEVSWQVTGIRQDAYAEAHRIEVETNKSKAERARGSSSQRTRRRRRCRSARPRPRRRQRRPRPRRWPRRSHGSDLRLSRVARGGRRTAATRRRAVTSA